MHGCELLLLGRILWVVDMGPIRPNHALDGAPDLHEKGQF